MFSFGCGLCRPSRREATGEPAGGSPNKQPQPAGLAPPRLSDMLRSKSENRILQAAMDSDTLSRCASMPAGSLLEASRRRLLLSQQAEAAEQAKKQLATEGATVMEFVQQYMQAIKDGNGSWASEPSVGQLFLEDARMVAADRQMFQGRSAIVRRLNQGVDTLAKMAGTEAQLPTFELSGPTRADGGSGSSSTSSPLVVKLVIRRSLQKLTFTLQFTMVQGRIAHLLNTRS